MNDPRARARQTLHRLALGLWLPLHGLYAAANPVPADELSLLNGAEQFRRLCTECHGWDPALQNADFDAEYPPEYGEPLATPIIPQPEEEEEFVVEPEVIDDWPEWAGPSPEVKPDEDERLRSDILEDLTSAIDDVYGAQTEPPGWDASDYETAEEAALAAAEDEAAGAFDREPGATDLTDPLYLVYGTSETDLYDNIAYGTGPTMPGFIEELGSEEAVWDVVNYIRSLWGEEYLE